MYYLRESNQKYWIFNKDYKVKHLEIKAIYQLKAQ